MFSIVLTASIILSAIDSSTGCATSDKVMALDVVVSQMNTTLQAIIHNASISTVVEYDTFLGLVCDNQLILQAAKAIEQQVISCPDLVNASTVGALELGLMTFIDLVEEFQSFDHFCECKPLWVQILSVSKIYNEIMLPDYDAFYEHIINMTAVCMLTSPSHSVNLMEVATVVQADKAVCPEIFQYTLINVPRLADFILSHCKYYRPELFTCALNYTKDDEFKSCLTLIAENRTSAADNNELLDEQVYRCGRADCAKMSLSECEYQGAVQYMWAVNIAQTDKQFQMLGCQPVSEASHIIHTTWVLITTILSVLILNTMI